MQRFQNKPSHLCSVCGTAVDLETCKSDERGMAVHEGCYLLKLTVATESNGAAFIIRCPYCKAGNEFRPMATRIEGWLQCEVCGHNVMPLDPEFRCACSKCAGSPSRRFPD